MTILQEHFIPNRFLPVVPKRCFFTCHPEPFFSCHPEPLFFTCHPEPFFSCHPEPAVGRVRDLLISGFPYKQIILPVSFIHPDPSSLIILPVDCFDHFLCCSLFCFYPAVHFLHINFSQHFFSQIAHVEYKLQKTCFIKSVFSSQVNKQFG